jgi:trimeric autotransporter adhesin
MPSWKKLIVSGSDASLSSLTATSYGGNISGSATSTGSFGHLMRLGGDLPPFNSPGLDIGIGGAGAGSALPGTMGNVVVGSYAGTALTTARNVYIGNTAGRNRNSGEDNILIGNAAGGGTSSSPIGDRNIIMGDSTAPSINSANADENIIMGYRAANSLTSGNKNLLIGGRDTAYNLTTGYENVALGYYAGYYGNNTGGVYIGAYSGPSGSAGHTNEIAIGKSATGHGSNTITLGNSDITDVHFASGSSTGARFHGIKDFAGNISGSATSTGSFGHLLVGGSEITSSPDATDGSQSTISGSATSTGSFGSVMQNGKHFPQTNAPGENIAFGTNAGSAFVGGNVNKINIAIGVNAGTAMADYGGNVYIGANAAKLRTRGDSNVCIGTSAGGTDGDDFGDKNVFIGLSTGLAINSTNSDSNVFIGNLAGTAGQQSIANVLIGDRAGNTLTNSSRNVAIGIFAGTGFGVTNTTTENGVYIGQYARTSATNANNEIVIGSEAVGHGTDTITLGDNQITDVYFASGSSTGATFHGIKDFAGNISGSSTSTGSFGHIRMNGRNFPPQLFTTGSSIYMGDGGTGLSDDGSGNDNVGIGTEVLTGIANGAHNVAIGNNALKARTVGSNNVAIGRLAGGSDADDFGSHNILIGESAGLNINNTGTSNNVMIGQSAGTAITNSYKNTFVGNAAGSTITTGYQNVAIGNNAGLGDGATAQTNQRSIFIGDAAKASANGNDNEIVIGKSTTGKGSNTVTIGNDDTTDFYITEGTQATLHTGTVSGSATSTGSFGAIQSAGNITPKVDNSVDLGAADKRFQNIFTTDLQLSNEGKENGNEVDGTTGSWTIQEGEEELYLLNRKNGKKYKFMLQEIK